MFVVPRIGILFKRSFASLELKPVSEMIYTFNFKNANQTFQYPIKKTYPMQTIFDKLKVDGIVDDKNKLQIYLADSKTILSSLTSLEFVLQECIQEGGFYIGKDAATADTPVGPSMIFCTLPSVDDLQLPIINQITAIDKELLPMEQAFADIEQDAKNSAHRYIWAGLFGLSAQFVLMARLTFWDLSWDVMEPIAYFIGFGTAIFGYLFFALYKREFSYDQLSNVTTSRRQTKLMKLKGLDVQILNDLKKRKAELLEDLQLVKELSGK